MWKLVVIGVAIAVMLLAGGYLAMLISPWPTALLVRQTLNQGGTALAQGLEKYVPAGVVGWPDQQYDASDPDSFLDVFTASDSENAQARLPTIVWIHGGGWISGSKNHIANYLKILAARGYTTAGVEYSLAPGKTYPTPLRQVNQAFAYLRSNAARLHVDPSKFILAGDSSGAQIAAQFAAIVSSPSYAKSVGIIPSVDRSELRGVMLYCGFYDAEFKKKAKPWLWSNVKTMLWSYLGTKDFLNDPRLPQFSITRYITAEFPPMFISVGNNDDLAPQSLQLAELAAARGVFVDSLFFPKTYAPPVSHEFQFVLDSEAGRSALERSIEFLADRSK
jgi:acetyl esterase